MKKILFVALAALVMLAFIACTASSPPTESEAPSVETETPTESPTVSSTASPAAPTSPEPSPTVETEYYSANLTTYQVTAAQPDNPYDIAYQEKVDSEISLKLAGSDYSIEAPFAAIDPYGTSALSMLLYFEDEPGYVSYTIHSPNSDASYTKTFDEVSVKHYIEVFGLFPNITNEITVRLYDEPGNLLKEASYLIDVPSITLAGVSDPNNPLALSVVSSTTGVSDGLFAMMGTIQSGHGYKNVYFYDNEGLLRGVLDTHYRADTLLQIGEGFLYPYDTRTIVHVSALGKTIALYRLNGYTMHHDLEIDKHGNIMVLVTKSSSGFQEDYMVTIDKDTGEIIGELDFKILFGDNADFFRLNGTDWLHANSIDYIDQKGGNLIVSSREASIIFSVTGADSGEYALEYIINEGTNASKLGLSDLNLSQQGEVNYCLGQHSAYYISGDDENHYQIVYYNNFYSRNNNRSSSSHPTSNLVPYEDIPGVDEMSFMTVLEIDTTSMTFSESHTIKFGFSRIRSSAIKYQDNYIASSTQVHEVVEVDADFNIVLKLTLRKSGVYRCNKYKIYD
ncbi:MAG: hypothetical protein HN389_05240 [Clostridia bacterium]|nr:hypothetical protein [Clostridia bacterium]